MNKLDITFHGQSCAVHIVMTSKRIKHIEYMSHPGMSTRTLATTYMAMRRIGGSCECADIADSLGRRYPTLFAAQINSGISDNPEGLNILNAWARHNTTVVKLRKR